MDGTWVRVSTKRKRLSEAKEAARELYIEYKIRQKNGLPVISKRFGGCGRLLYFGHAKAVRRRLGQEKLS